MPPSTRTRQIIGGHYQIEKFLGKGGFGETYLARDTHLPNHPYRIVKKLKPQSTEPFVLQAIFQGVQTLLLGQVSVQLGRRNAKQTAQNHEAMGRDLCVKETNETKFMN